MKILLVEDDEALAELLVKALDGLSFEVVVARDGVEALDKAPEVQPELVILDIGLPGKDGYEVCRDLRRKIRTRHIPILFLTGRAGVPDKIEGFNVGADDYLTKPFNQDEIRVRIQGLMRRNRQTLSANPLTRLPGGPVIEEEAARRLGAGEPFAFAYIDIDNFKSYNDTYGYKKGDEAILRLAALLIEIVEGGSRKGDFVGHIGGDDFVLLTVPSSAHETGLALARRFDAEVVSLYGREDRARGFVETFDRKGARRKFPLMTLSVAVVTNQSHPISHYARLVEMATELKSFLKQREDKKSSAVLVDRRN